MPSSVSPCRVPSLRQRRVTPSEVGVRGPGGANTFCRNFSSRTFRAGLRLELSGPACAVVASAHRASATPGAAATQRGWPVTNGGPLFTEIPLAEIPPRGIQRYPRQVYEFRSLFPLIAHHRSSEARPIPCAPACLAVG